MYCPLLQGLFFSLWNSTAVVLVRRHTFCLLSVPTMQIQAGLVDWSYRFWLWCFTFLCCQLTLMNQQAGEGSQTVCRLNELQQLLVMLHTSSFAVSTIHAVCCHVSWSSNTRCLCAGESTHSFPQNLHPQMLCT